MRPYGQYQQAYKRASVTTIDQNKLIVMLYDGAIKHITMGIQRMQSKDIEKTHHHLVKAKSIISELMSSLNEEKGGEIAQNLKSLYSYMFSQLIDANVNKTTEPAMTVLNLLKELREAWGAIGNSKGLQQGNQQSLPGEPKTVKSINIKG
jgi:flagellar secretion chaperone FliS